MTTEQERDLAVNALRLLVREIKTGKARQFIRKEDRQVAEDVLELVDPKGDGKVIYFTTADGVVIHDPTCDPEHGAPLESVSLEHYWQTQGVRLQDIEDGLRRWGRVHVVKY